MGTNEKKKEKRENIIQKLKKEKNYVKKLDATLH